MNDEKAILLTIAVILIVCGGLVYSMKIDGKKAQNYFMPKLNSLNLTVISDVEIDSPSLIHIVQSFDEFYDLLLEYNVTTLYLEKKDRDPRQYAYFFSDDFQIAWKWPVSSVLHRSEPN